MDYEVLSWISEVFGNNKFVAVDSVNAIKDYKGREISAEIIGGFTERTIDQIRAQCRALGIPVGIVGKVQRLFDFTKGGKQIHIGNAQLLQQIVESFHIGSFGFYAVIGHKLAVQGVFIGCNDECKFPAGFAAVFIHQRHIAGSTEQLSIAHGRGAGIIAQRIGKQHICRIATHDAKRHHILTQQDRRQLSRKKRLSGCYRQTQRG